MRFALLILRIFEMMKPRHFAGTDFRDAPPRPFHLPFFSMFSQAMMRASHDAAIFFTYAIDIESLI